MLAVTLGVLSSSVEAAINLSIHDVPLTTTKNKLSTSGAK